MRYQEFKNIYNENNNISFSKFQNTLFQVQKLLDKTYDVTASVQFINLIEGQDLNSAKTLRTAMNIYKNLFIMTNSKNLVFA